MAVRRNSRNNAVIASLDRCAMNAQRKEQDVKEKPAIKTDVIANKQLNAPTEAYKKKEAIIKQNFLKSIRSFDTIITKAYLSDLTSCEVVPCTVDPISNMRWVKVNEIVYEKNEFFVDKLSKLYNALHSTARNVCFLLRRGYCKKNKSAVEIFIGTTDANLDDKNISGDILQRGLKGLFPGVSAEISGDVICELNEEINNNVAISCVSGVASLQEDDKKERFVQGLEKLIDSTSGLKFAVCFIAEKVEDSECSSILANYESLYSAIAPMAETQLSFSQNETKGINETSSKTFTDTVGASLSKTITKGSSYSLSHTEGSSYSYSETFGKSETINAIVYSNSDNYSESYSGSTNSSDSETSTTNQSYSDQEAINRALAIAVLQGQGSHHDKQNGFTQQITLQDRRIKHYQYLLDKEINRLQNALPYGLWSMGTYFIAEDDTTASALAGLYKGCIVGDKSNSQVFTINNWHKNDKSTKTIGKYLLACQHPRFLLPSNIEVASGSLVSSKELAIHMSLPQTSVPGILVREETSFGREVNSNITLVDTNSINLGHILHLGEEYKIPVRLSIDELTKHMFVTGSTGSGKSNTMYLILSQLKQSGIKFMVVEPAKGEYKHVFGNDEDVTVYSNSPKCGKLLQINPFAFPYQTIDLLEHVDRLVGIFNACWPMYAAMPSVLKKSIVSAYQKCGWDLLLSENPYKKANEPVYPTIEDVLSALKDYINNSEYSDETKGDYKGALETRLSDLKTGLLGLIFSGNPVSDEDLFNQNSIIDLSRIGSYETKALIMGFLVMKLNEFRMSEGGINKKISHVTILEEAHNLLKRTTMDQSQDGANLAGKSVEMISNSIAEMRTYGEGFIIVDQAPSLLDTSAIRNTNTKIVMALPEDNDRIVAGKSMALSVDQIEQIARQSVGEAIVYQNSWEEAVHCKINKYQGDNNERYLKQYQMPIIAQRVARAEVLDFLLYKLTNKNIDFQQVAKFIEEDTMPSSMRVCLLELLSEYRETNSVSLWDKKHFSKLMSVVSNYLNIDQDVLKIKKLIMSVKDIPKYRVLFDELLQNSIKGNIDARTLFYIEQGYSKTMRPELYEQWKETFNTK